MPLAAFCSDFCAASSASRATSIWVREASAFASRACGEIDLRDGRVAGLCHLLLLLSRARPLLLESGEACVLQFGERERGLRRLDAGAGLVDALLDVVAGQFQGFLRPFPIRNGGCCRPPGDLDLDRHFLADAVQVGALASQLGLGRFQLSPGDVDLVAVRNGVDLRYDLPLDDLVVLIDEVPDKSAGDDLRGDVDDVGLDEDVVGDRVITPVFDPAQSSRKSNRDQGDD